MDAIARTINFSIFDSGNLVASYGEEQAALDALAQLVREDPEACDELVLLAFDDDGEPAGEPVLGSSFRSEQPVSLALGT
jgi:hypothetical protein